MRTIHYIGLNLDILKSKRLLKNINYFSTITILFTIVSLVATSKPYTYAIA